MKQSSIPRMNSAPRPKLGTQLTSPTSPKFANGSVSHHVDSPYTARVEVGPVLESPKGPRTPIGSKSPIGSTKSPVESPRNSLSERGSKSPRAVKSPSSTPKLKQNGSDAKSEGEGSEESDEARADRAFDSFVMTGDMIIRTTPKKAGSLERGTSPQVMADYASSGSASASSTPKSTTSSTPEKYDENSNQHCFTGPSDETKPRSCMVTSKSAEKVQYASMNKNLMSCYSSKSHENYLENTQSYVVDIDIDEKIATSFDALMLEQSSTSIDRLITDSRRSEFFRLEGTRVQEESSTDVCPNCRSEIFDTVCACVDDSRPPPLPAERAAKAEEYKAYEYKGGGYLDRCPAPERGPYALRNDRHLYHERSESAEDDAASETGSIYHQPTKDIDRPSAIRLAKRLYNLEGFRKSDVSRHLSKKNDFSQLVGEEYLKYFDFTGDTLDKALRKFLNRFSLTGETQERERILNHFSHRYMECNANTYNSDDACHTLTCAIMLLNTDLHGQNIGRKMTSSEFVENLSDLNDGEDFPTEILRQLYTAIKTEPLVWALDEEEGQNGHCPSAFLADNGSISAQNPFLMVPDPTKTTEYISGYVMRKCCIDQDGRKTPMGKRSWKMFYATLKDMILYLHKDQNSFHKTSVYHMNNAIRIHHALAVRANDYTKKHHVFRLKTADWAEYLFQTSDSKELQRWIDTINYVAASLSAPPLPGAVGSQRKFQRPLMPSSYTRLNLQQQLLQHESRLDELEHDLKDHRTYPPEKGAKPRIIQDYLEKEEYLEYELKRFNMYVYLLQARLQAFPPTGDLEPSLVETVIGEVDESNTSPVVTRNESKHAKDEPRRPVSERHSRHVQRSLSDRYSYRAAVCKADDPTSGELLDDSPDGASDGSRRSLQDLSVFLDDSVDTVPQLGAVKTRQDADLSFTVDGHSPRNPALYYDDKTVQLTHYRVLEVDAPVKGGVISDDETNMKLSVMAEDNNEELGENVQKLKRKEDKKQKKKAKLWFRRTVIEIPTESVAASGDTNDQRENIEKDQYLDDVFESPIVDEAKSKKKQSKGWMKKFTSRTPEPKRAKVELDDNESPVMTRSLPEGTFFTDSRKGSFSSGKSTTSVPASSPNSSTPDVRLDNAEKDELIGDDAEEPVVMRMTSATFGPLVLSFGADVAAEQMDVEGASTSQLERYSNVDLPQIELVAQPARQKTSTLKRWFRKKRSQSFKVEGESPTMRQAQSESQSSDGEEVVWKKEKRSSATWYSRESTV